METRAEYVAWAKRRALEYLDVGEIEQAYTSMASDLQQHDELRNHPAIQLGLLLLLGGHLSTVREMRKFIEDFN